MTTEFNRDRRRFLLRSGAAVVASQLGAFGSVAMSLFHEGSLPRLDGATQWLNSRPIEKTDLRGRVTLIDFWTYTCINWRRTLPYIRAWHAKYKQQGLIVIGVHTPEFEFEKDPGNVSNALKQMQIDYPVALDSEYAVWRAFNNEYWPAIYLADAQGRIRYQKFGEGNYEEVEREIQRLLKQSGGSGISSELTSIHATGAEAAADWSDLRSQENYVGHERTVGFSSPGRTVFDKPHDYALPRHQAVNEWALAGNWTLQKNAAVLNSNNGRIAYRFHARDLHLVMGPAAARDSIRFRVSLDGRAPGVAHGSDVDGQGNRVVTESRMYQLIRQPMPINDRTFEIEFLNAGLEAFSFTFG